MFANIACACASNDMDSEPAGSEHASHHHHSANSDDNETTQCVHVDCDGCDELFDNCATPVYSVVSVDRDARMLSVHKIDLDGPDLDLAFLDTGQAWQPLPPQSYESRPSTALSWVADTPIRRKDQLTQ